MATEHDETHVAAASFRSVFERSPDAILVLDDESGAVLAANEAAADRFETSRERLRERTLADLSPDGDGTALVREAADSGSVETVWEIEVPGGAASRADVTISRPDGGEGQLVAVFETRTDQGREADELAQKTHLETVVQNLPVVLFAVDPDGTFTLSQGKALSTLGLEPGEAVGMSIREQYAGQPDVLDAIERALDGEPVETVAELGDTSFKTWYRPVTDDDGEVTQVLGVAMDVTDRIAREAQLEENEAILDQLTSATDDVFWLFNDDFSEVLFVNEAYEEVWGRPIEAVREDAMDFLQGVHPDDREMVVDALQRLQQGEETDLEYRVNPDEDFGRWVWVRGEPILDEDGAVERIAGFARDITERKERVERLEESERQFEAVFNDPHALVGLLDTDGTTLRVNETALESTPVGRDAIVGTPFEETPWWSHDEGLQSDLAQWIDRAGAGEYVEFEAEHPLPDGGLMAVEGTIRPVLDEDGAVVSLIAAARDITERREQKRQLEKSNERLEQFAYVASHDLQEPLRTVSNYTEMIADDYGDDLPEEAEELVDVVVTGSERMQSMINGLLDYSRVTTRGEEFEPVDTEQAVADVADDLSVLLEEHDGTLEWGALPTVDADGDQFRQLVQNLVKNALEHGTDGPVNVEIRGAAEGDRYRFEVEDDGPGIEQRRQDKIFRIFKSGTQYQTSSQAKGIGLAICDNIVDRHGGDIWVESEPGEGATFVFTIDRDLAETEPADD